MKCAKKPDENRFVGLFYFVECILLQKRIESITLSDVARIITFHKPFFSLCRGAVCEAFLVHVALRPFLDIIITNCSRSAHCLLDVARL